MNLCLKIFKNMVDRHPCHLQKFQHHSNKKKKRQQKLVENKQTQQCSGQRASGRNCQTDVIIFLPKTTRQTNRGRRKACGQPSMALTLRTQLETV